MRERERENGSESIRRSLQETSWPERERERERERESERERRIS